MKVDGETAYLVTNHHVVADAPKGRVYPEVTVVFNSGTRDEKSVKAEVLAAQRSADPRGAAAQKRNVEAGRWGPRALALGCERQHAGALLAAERRELLGELLQLLA